mgnify:CR=1 FL=1
MKYTNVYSKNSSPVLYHLLAFFVAAVWGVSFVSTSKLLDAGIQPTEIYIIRFVIAYLVILVLTFRKIMSDSLKDEALFIRYADFVAAPFTTLARIRHYNTHWSPMYPCW